MGRYGNSLQKLIQKGLCIRGVSGPHRECSADFNDEHRLDSKGNSSLVFTGYVWPDEVLDALCEFMYMDFLTVPSGDASQGVLANLMHLADAVAIDPLFDHCVHHLGQQTLSSPIFYELQGLYSDFKVRDETNRKSLLSLLRRLFRENFELFSADPMFASILPSSLVQIMEDNGTYPARVMWRWNTYRDKDLVSLEKVSLLVASPLVLDMHLRHFTVSNTKTDETFEHTFYSLKSRSETICITSDTECRMTWMVSGLIHNRLSLFSGLIEIRQTEAVGIYEFQLKNGAVDPPTSHTSGSSEQVVFDIQFKPSQTSVWIGSCMLLSTQHAFKSCDLKLSHHHKDESTCMVLLDCY